MLTLRNAIIFAAAMGLLLLAVGLEHPYFSTSGDEFHSVIFQLSSLVALLKEVAFALLIALVITIGIETESRRHDRENADSMRKLIAIDVFKGVFSRQIDKTYVDLVVASHLQPTIIRTSLNIHWNFENIEKRVTGGENDAQREYINAIKLRSTYSFTLENTTSTPYIGSLPFSVPVRSHVDNKITKATIGGVVFSDDALAEMKEDATESVLSYGIPVNIPVGGTTDIEVEVIVFKDISDNEIWTTFHPTMKTDIILSNGIPGLAFGLVARTATPAESIADQKNWRRWVINGPILKGESVVIWWSTQGT